MNIRMKIEFVWRNKFYLTVIALTIGCYWWAWSFLSENQHNLVAQLIGATVVINSLWFLFFILFCMGMILENEERRKKGLNRRRSKC